MSPRTTTQRHPRSAPEFLAYQLSRRLGDTENVGQYLKLTSVFPIASLLQIYREARVAGDTTQERRRTFWQIIERTTHHE